MHVAHVRGTAFASKSRLERLFMAKNSKSSPLFILVAMLTALAAMYFAREILLPVALAILLSFLLTPATNRLERWHIPRHIVRRLGRRDVVLRARPVGLDCHRPTR